MEANIAAWMIAGGPKHDNPHAMRDLEQLYALLESQRVAHEDRPGLIARIRTFAQPKPAAPALDCCAA